jgi:RNA-directed DNA polymerase
MKLKALGEWLKMIRNMLPLKELWRTFKAKLAGHFQYYGVSGNSRAIQCSRGKRGG